MRRIATTLTLIALGAAPALAQSLPGPQPSFGAPIGLDIPGLQVESGGHPPIDLSDQCGASAYQHLVGQPLADAVKSGEADGASILDYDGVYSTIYVADRLNFSIHEDEIIHSVHCG